MDLSPPARTTVVDACAEQLERAVLSGSLRPGERLPPERELASQLGVNRVTVRSALTRMAASGLLDVRQGSGYTVRDFHRVGGPGLLPGLVALASTEGDLPALVGEVLRVRRHLSRALLERLAEVRPDPAPVSEAVEDFGRAVAEGASTETLAKADLAVLESLLEASGSAVLQLCFNPIAAVLGVLPSLRDAMFCVPATNLAGWRMVVAWLADPRPDAVGTVAGLLAVRDEDTLDALR